MTTKLKNEIKLSRLLEYGAGMFFIAFGVTFMLKSNLGNSSWDTLHYSMEHLFNISFGTAMIIVAMIFTVIIIILNKSLKYLLMAIPIVIVGPLVDLTNNIFNSTVVPESLVLQIIYFLIGLLALPLGGAFLLISTYPAGVFDEFNLAVVRKLKLKSLVPTRVIMELSAVALAGVLGYLAGFELNDLTFGKIGIGTIVFALLIGFCLKTYLKIFERIGLYENQQTN